MSTKSGEADFQTVTLFRQSTANNCAGVEVGCVMISLHFSQSLLIADDKIKAKRHMELFISGHFRGRLRYSSLEGIIELMKACHSSSSQREQSTKSAQGADVGIGTCHWTVDAL